MKMRTAMIMVAGRGERLKPLTDSVPKPLIPVGGKPLVEHHLYRLKKAGFTDIVLNPGWLGGQLIKALGTGERFGLNLHYSVETPGRYETGGGLKKALPLLSAHEPLLLVNGDVLTDIDFEAFYLAALASDAPCYLALVKNPPHNSEGDFRLSSSGRVSLKNDSESHPAYTYSGVSVLQPASVSNWPEERFSLGDVLRHFAKNKALAGTLHEGVWLDVGTPERLKIAEASIRLIE